MTVKADFVMLAIVGVALVGSLVVLIWRAWHDPSSSVAEQRALLGVAANIALSPGSSLAVAYLLKPTLGVLGAFTLVFTAVSLVLLARIHGATLGHEGLYRRVRNLVLYYSYLFFLLSQFPKLHVALSWYIGDPGKAHVVLLAALLVPGILSLASARPGAQEWGRWWPIRQWSALFLVILLALWMGLTSHW